MKKYDVPKWVSPVIYLINIFLSHSSRSVCEMLLIFQKFRIFLDKF